MVLPFDKAINQIATNTTVMAKQMPVITDSVKKIYDTQKKENKEKEKIKIEQERKEADTRGKKKEEEKGTSKIIKDLTKALSSSNKEQGGILGNIVKLLLSKIPGVNLLVRQQGGFVYKSPIQTFQKGGGVYTVPGNSTGDRHPMLLPAGSFVLNRNASQHIGGRGGKTVPTMPFGFQDGGMVPTLVESKEKIFAPGHWDGLIPILNSVIPRFQNGGLVSHPHTGEGYQPTGATDAQGRPVVLSKEAAESFRKMMEAGGINPVDVTSSQRSREHNAKVGGVPNSNHLYGNAMDIHGQSKLWLKDGNAEQYGWKWLNYGGHDGHFDFIKAIGASTPKQEGSEKTDEGQTIAPSDNENSGFSITNLLGEGFAAFANMPQLQPLIELVKMFSSFSFGSGDGGGGSLGNAGDGATSINDPNARALLNAIADAEGTSQYPDQGYKTFFGGDQLKGDYPSDHPRIDKGGSDAFGRYQFMSPTWAEYANGRDMSPGGQDAVALDLITKKRGVNIKDGLSQDEVQSLSWEWASIKGNNYTYGGRAQAYVDQSDFLKMYEGYGGKIQEKQTGGIVQPFPGSLNDMVPVKVESGEKIFSPGSYGPEIQNLNDNVPRFQSGGQVNLSQSMNPIHNNFREANNTRMSSESTRSQPIVVPVPQPIPMGGGGMSNDSGSGSFTPNLPNEPSNHIVSTLMMQTYSLMNRIG
jgi:muramidase (phage lysozyme)